MHSRFRRATLALAAALSLASCASLPTTAASPAIDDLPGMHALLPDAATLQASDAGADHGHSTHEAMSRESAVRFALLHSPRLQAEYARLGIARADLVQARLPANPGFDFGRLTATAAAHPQTSLALGLPLADWLLLPARKRMAEADYQQARFRIAHDLIDLVADIEAAWYACVAAQQVAELRITVAEASATSAELAQRFHAAGNISELQLRQEQAAASEARIASARARVAALASRMALDELIGLDGESDPRPLTDRLPLPVAQEDDPAVLLGLAVEKRLDLVAARQHVLVLVAKAAHQRRWRLLGGAELALERESETDGEDKRGAALSLQLPLFDQGQGRIATADAHLALARSELARIELDTGIAVRAKMARVRALRDIVDIHREALIPQHEDIVARSQEQQNFMLIGVFELIQAKTREYDAYQGYLEAIRDYWLERTELMRAVGTRLPSEIGIATTTPAIGETVVPGAIDHRDHDLKNMDHSGHHPSIPPASDNDKPSAPSTTPEETETRDTHHNHHGDKP